MCTRAKVPGLSAAAPPFGTSASNGKARVAAFTARLLRVQRRLGIVERLLRDELAFVELVGPLMRLLRERELRRRLLHVRRLLDRGETARLVRAVLGERPGERRLLLIEVVLQLLAI